MILKWFDSLLLLRQITHQEKRRSLLRSSRRHFINRTTRQEFRQSSLYDYGLGNKLEAVRVRNLLGMLALIQNKTDEPEGE